MRHEIQVIWLMNSLLQCKITIPKKLLVVDSPRFVKTDCFQIAIKDFFRSKGRRIASSKTLIKVAFENQLNNMFIFIGPKISGIMWTSTVVVNEPCPVESGTFT